MDMALDYVGLVATTGLSAYVLAVPIIGYAVGGEIVGKYIYDGFIKPLWCRRHPP